MPTLLMERKISALLMVAEHPVSAIGYWLNCVSPKLTCGSPNPLGPQNVTLLEDRVFIEVIALK